MSDTPRFTPLYVIRIFLDFLYYRNKNLVIPEAFLESDPTFEECLCQDLKEINEIANLGDSDQIIKFVTEIGSLHTIFNVERRYGKIYKILFKFHLSQTMVDDVESFMKNVRVPDVINCDILRDLMPAQTLIMYGDHQWGEIFDCIFRYILYVKTKHLIIFDQAKLNFRPEKLVNHIDEMKNDHMFNF